MENQKPAVGDILYASYGYDATFYDFYKVVGVTEKSVKLRKLAKKFVGESTSYADYVVPVEDEFDGIAFSRKLKIYESYGGWWSIRINDYKFAQNIWSGQQLGQSPVGTY